MGIYFGDKIHGIRVRKIVQDTIIDEMEFKTEDWEYIGDDALVKLHEKYTFEELLSKVHHNEFTMNKYTVEILREYSSTYYPIKSQTWSYIIDFYSKDFHSAEIVLGYAL